MEPYAELRGQSAAVERRLDAPSGALAPQHDSVQPWAIRLAFAIVGF